MLNLIDYEAQYNTLRVLVTGISGSGKTTLAASLAAKYKLIWLDTENALDTLKKLPIEYKHNISVVKIPDSSAFPIAAQTIQKLFKELEASICLHHGVVSCPVCIKDKAVMQTVSLKSLPRDTIVVLDSLTQVGRSFMSHIMKNAALNTKPERDDWGSLRRATEFLAGNIQAFPFNFVATALTTEGEQKDGSVRLVPEFGSSGMSAGIGAKFSTVVYIEAKNKKHSAFSSSTASNLFQSKSRVAYKIEDDTGPLSLVPMFDSFLAAPTTPTPPAPRVSLAKETDAVPPAPSAKTILNNLKKGT